MTMEDRVGRLESYCAACPIRLVDVERQRDDIGNIKVAVGRIEERLENIDHWIHDGGNPVAIERRVHSLELWKAFMAGTGAALTAALTAAIAWVARGN